MHLADFWQKLQVGVEVAVSATSPASLLGVRDGFLRYLGEGMDRSVPVAVVPDSEAAPASGLAFGLEENLGSLRLRLRQLEDRLGSDYHFLVVTDGGIEEVVVGEESRCFVRNWTLISSPIGEAWGSSGAIQLPAGVLDRQGVLLPGPGLAGTRRAGGLVQGLTAGLEDRRRAVGQATVHALSSLFYDLLEPRKRGRS